jgi:hypothetical protein
MSLGRTSRDRFVVQHSGRPIAAVAMACVAKAGGAVENMNFTPVFTQDELRTTLRPKIQGVRKAYSPPN